MQTAVLFVIYFVLIWYSFYWLGEKNIFSQPIPTPPQIHTLVQNRSFSYLFFSLKFFKCHRCPLSNMATHGSLSLDYITPVMPVLRELAAPPWGQDAAVPQKQRAGRRASSGSEQEEQLCSQSSSHRMLAVRRAPGEWFDIPVPPSARFCRCAPVALRDGDGRDERCCVCATSLH